MYLLTQKLILISAILSSASNTIIASDVSIVGYIKDNDGLGSIPKAFFACLKDQFSCSFVNTRKEITKDINVGFNPKLSSKISILTDSISWAGGKAYKYMPKSKIKIAYSMYESDRIPDDWIETLNNHFDAAVVPDEYFVDVYAGCGVTIPIFVIPIPMENRLFENINYKTDTEPFRFGSSGFFTDRKNQLTLVKAFSSKFKNNPNVILKLHGKADWGYLKEIINYIEIEQINNIEIISKELSDVEYAAFFQSLNCYVLASKGEGFSLTVRQAMSCGMPCIITNNTAHTTLCLNSAILSVPCKNITPYYNPAISKACGNYFECSTEDLGNALAQMFEQYDYYLSKSQDIKDFININYSIDNVAPLLRTLIAPSEIYLDNTNYIANNGELHTSSKSLYQKYRGLAK